MTKNKEIIIKILCVIIIILGICNLFASRDYEIEIKTGEKRPLRPVALDLYPDLNVLQPDGSQITIHKTAFFSIHRIRESYLGYSYISEDRSYTIILDSDSGFWCYAQRGDDGWLESTGFPVHLYKGSDLGLKMLIRPSSEREEELIQMSKDEEAQLRNFNAPWIKMPSIGDIQSLVVYVILADQNPNTSFIDNGWFNGNSPAHSTQWYFQEVSRYVP